MGNFTLSEKFETEFDEDVIVYELERANVGVMKDLAPFMDNSSKASFKDEIEAIEVMGGVIRAHVNFIRLPKTKEGIDVDPKYIYEKQYFMPLIAEMFNNLIEISNLKVEEVKKSGSASMTDAKEGSDQPPLESVV